MAKTCSICGNDLDQDNRLVLVVGKVYQLHCSDYCLAENVRTRRLARAAVRRRWLLRWLVVTTVLAAGGTLWNRYRAPPPEVISSGPPDPLPSEPAPPPAPPIYFGPAWPPTDEDWMEAFDRARWIYPLPGPSRRAGTIDSKIFGPDPSNNLPSLCHMEGRCGVDLGGDLWGEHVYAVQDGIVDRLRGSGPDERGGNFVRLSHFGGMVFTHYFHLAATPRRLARGVRVKAGDVVGLLGDTGIKGARRHLHFALSVRPSAAFPEVYWDPLPWMGNWPMRLPANGTVAGLEPPPREREKEPPRRRRRR